MNRHYTTEEYVAACVRFAVFSRSGPTTDLIAGFRRTEEEFAQTLGFVEKVGFYRRPMCSNIPCGRAQEQPP